MAKKELHIEDDIIDLTELIESGNSGDRRAANSYARTASMQAPPDDDFESLLAQESSGEHKKADPEESLDMAGMGGIDNLLESLDIPAQPREPDAAAKAAVDDLDNALDDLLGPEPASTPEQKTGDAADGLDDLLNDMPSEEPAPADRQVKTVPDADMSNLDADLDDILSSFDEPATKKQPVPPADKTEDITADLDDILNDVPPPVAPEPEIEAKPASESEPVAVQLPDGEMPAEVPVDEPGDASDEEPFMEPEPAITSPEDLEIPDSADSITPQPEAQPESTHMPALGLDAQSSSLQAMPAAIWSPESVANLCRNISTIHDSAAQEALRGFARELGEQSAHVEDFGAQLEQLAKRVMACESRLSAARVKIANLEKAMESTAALDDLLREGTPLHAGFMGLIAAAVSNALQSFSLDAPKPDPEVLKRLDSLTVRVAETAERVSDLEKRIETGESQASGEATDDMGKLINGLENSDARIAALERKLGELNREIGEKLEKTAAATAARVLQEEIARLIQDGNGI